ncbi:hypothetical protein NYE59_30180 [Paenibacillus sp. FSL L8-0323]|uniref:hypothetical protein n=1 Tax=Paenibacillus sp. FSL L8-0323 TaxID=2975330 RepID=UPI0030FBBEAB
MIADVLWVLDDMQFMVGGLRYAVFVATGGGAFAALWWQTMYRERWMIYEERWTMCDLWWGSRHTAGDLRGSFGRRTFVFTAFCVWAMCGVDLKLIREKFPEKSQYFL